MVQLLWETQGLSSISSLLLWQQPPITSVRPVKEDNATPSPFPQDCRHYLQWRVWTDLTDPKNTATPINHGRKIQAGQEATRNNKRLFLAEKDTFQKQFPNARTAVFGTWRVCELLFPNPEQQLEMLGHISEVRTKHSKRKPFWWCR